MLWSRLALVLLMSTGLGVGAAADPKAWDGTWAGAWGNFPTSVTIENDRVVAYRFDDRPAAVGTTRTDGDVLSFGSGFTITLKRLSTDSAEAHYAGPQGKSQTVLTRQTQPGPTAARPTRQSIQLATDLEENGAPIDLQVILHRPAGPGPFPLLVFNSGSPPDKRDGSADLDQVFSAPALARLFSDRGWMVAFPQRRGRGRSSGTFDHTGRNRCSVSTALAGAKRRVADIDAAVRALKQRPDVDAGRIVVGGQSWGGILSVAYGGLHPDDALAIVNFVGGWKGTGCPRASQVNKAVFALGAAYPRQSLWIYGDDDPFYPLSHSRSNHADFVRRGGQAAFVAVMPWDKRGGHDILATPGLWKAELDYFLTEAGAWPGESRPTYDDAEVARRLEAALDDLKAIGANAIRATQRELTVYGYRPGGIDGRIGPGTTRALEACIRAARC